MRSDRSEFYQWALILSMAVAAVLTGVFVYREVFPEYKEYQNRYVALEEFRSTYTGQEPAPFSTAIKQIVLTRDDDGPESIDRCVSCHVALKLEHFSPTILARDINGQLQRNTDGTPVKISNPNYVWGKLETEIAQLSDPAVNAQLEQKGDWSEIKRRETRLHELHELQSVHGHEGSIDVSKVLQMHPLLGRETRAFEYHPIEEYGCTSCHGGNGRGLVTDRAHGPVIDGSYHIEEEGPRPVFLETDPENDPKFSQVFNGKPGHRLLFQTKPLLVGALMQSKCMQCHKTSEDQIKGIADAMGTVVNRKEKQVAAIVKGVQSDKAALLALLETKDLVKTKGTAEAVVQLQASLTDFTLSPEELDAVNSRIKFLSQFKDQKPEAALAEMDVAIANTIGHGEVATAAEKELSGVRDPGSDKLNAFIQAHQNNPLATGSLFAKERSLADISKAIDKVEQAKAPIANLAADTQVVQTMAAESGQLVRHYARGEKLFFSQGCYACHKISGLTRGGVGPELSQIGLAYPWYVKESIVWPQADLKTSTMPNFKLDHEEVEDLMAFLMAQRGPKAAVSKVDAAVNLRTFEEGAKASWEQPVSPEKIKDLRYAQVVFGTQGCSSCHRLKGFESDVGYAIEKSKPGLKELLVERNWFEELFPVDVLGSQIVATLDEHGAEIRKRISKDVRSNSVVEEIDSVVDGGVEAFYSAFKFAKRAKNAQFEQQRQQATTETARAEITREEQEWKDTVRLVMMQYVQEYGFGRDIGPRLHWSGVYRDDEWLVQHFRNPGAHTAKSLMPVLPFDDTKFYALTNMLQEMGKHNRDELRQIWDLQGFDAEQAFTAHCSSCHGRHMHGDGPVARWIYPIPKNLKNATFLRNLTRERAIASIMHGVKGTPMPPWGEAPKGRIFEGEPGRPVLSEREVTQLVDWIFLGLPGARVIESDSKVDKWRYEPEDFIKELQNEGAAGQVREEVGVETHLQASALVGLPPANQIYVDANPRVYVAGTATSKAGEVLSVKDLFDTVDVKDVDGQGDPVRYYLKKELYTAENINAGERFFVQNCAHCHGKEGGGNGLRAGTMDDAKPRMLSNLPWLRTRDDLRLLRSIKYGVPGTSMTPWGDQSSAMQRMQLVMFIRSLTADRKLRDDLDSIVYQVFERDEIALTQARAEKYSKISELQAQYEQLQQERQEAQIGVQKGVVSAADAAHLYEKELTAMESVKALQQTDDKLQSLLASLRKEKELYKGIGRAFIDRSGDERLVNEVYEIIQANDHRFEFHKERLIMKDTKQAEATIDKLAKQIVSSLDAHAAEVEKRRTLILGQLSSAQRDEHLQEVSQELQSVYQLKRKLVSSIDEVAKYRTSQKATYETLNG